LSQIFGTRGFPNPIRRGRDGGIYFATSQEQLQAWNTDGSVKWTSQLHEVCDGDVTKIVNYDNGLNGTILVFTDCSPVQKFERGSSKLYALNGLDGSIQWEHVPMWWAYRENVLPEMAVSDDTIYLQTVNSGTGGPFHQLEAIDAAGALKWAKSFNISPSHSHGSTTLMVGPTGVFTGDEQFLSALSPENGSVRWTFAAASKMSNKYAFTKDGGVFVTQSTTQGVDGANIYEGQRLDLLHLSFADGRVLWNVSGSSTDPAQAGAPILGSSGEVYVRDMVNEDGVCNLRAFDGEGNPLRVFPCHYDYHHLTKQNEDGTTEDIFVALSEQFPLSVIAYSGASSHLLWNLDLDMLADGQYISLRCVPGAGVPGAGDCHLKAGENGTVFLVVPQDWIKWDEPSVAIAVRDGLEAWRTSVDDWWFGDPGHMLMVEDGTTYNMHTDKNWELDALEALDVKGMQKWNFTAPQFPVLI